MPEYAAPYLLACCVLPSVISKYWMGGGRRSKSEDGNLMLGSVFCVIKLCWTLPSQVHPTQLSKAKFQHGNLTKNDWPLILVDLPCGVHSAFFSASSSSVQFASQAARKVIGLFLPFVRFVRSCRQRRLINKCVWIFLGRTRRRLDLSYIAAPAISIFMIMFSTHWA